MDERVSIKKELARLDGLINFYEKLVNQYPEAVSYADTKARLIHERAELVTAIGRNRKCQSNMKK